MTTATGTVIEMSVAETEIWITDVGATTKIARDTVIENTVTDVVATVIVNEIAIGIETGTTEIATEIGMIGRMNGKMTATGTEIWVVGVDMTTKTETGTAVDMMWKGIAIETEGAGAGAERVHERRKPGDTKVDCCNTYRRSPARLELEKEKTPKKFLMKPIYDSGD